MRVQKRIPWVWSLGVGLAALALGGTRAGADVSSDRPGSVVIWPKVIADGTRDTLITLTNTSNSMAFAHCEYTQGTGVCSLSPDFCSLTTSDSCPEIPGGPPNLCVIDCASHNFDVILTRQQPTMWRVSTGRFENLLSGSGTACTTFPTTPPTQSCPGLFEVGSVIPAPNQANSSAEFGGFRGELRCVETASDGSPLGADALKGEAMIEGVNAGVNGGPLLSEYNSINVLADGQNLNGNVLELNGFQGYNACPDAIDIIHYARGGEDLVADSLGATCTGGTCDVETDFTIIPCRRDYENATATPFNVDFEAKDEFESNFSREVPFACWADADLATLGFTNVNGATFMRTRATSTGSGICISGPGAMPPNGSCLGAGNPLSCCTGLGTGNCQSSFCRSDDDCGSGGVCAPASGILAIVEEFHPTARTTGDASLVGSAAANTHAVDSNGDGSFERLGHCRGHLATRCIDNSDCPTGLCRIQTSTSCTTNADCTGVSGDFCDRCMNDEITRSLLQ